MTEGLLDFDRREAAGMEGYLAGVDEAGRGPLAGPVVAAAVILTGHGCLDGLNDSKKLTAAKREKLYIEIYANAVVSVGIATEQEIDELNIYQATRLAMKKAVLGLKQQPAFVLIDGNMKIDISMRQKAIVRGDQKSASIAAASVIAKVYRDAWMQQLDEMYPQYGFGGHKGYPTKDHVENLRKHGPSPVHRRTFGPVQQLIAEIHP